MQTTWIEIAGFAVRAPVTAGTNLFLAVQCFLYFRSLRAAPAERSRLWSGFFLMMALATFAGVFKHGFQHELSETALVLLLWASNLTGGVSTYYAQRATIAAHAPKHLRCRLDRLPQAQLLAFLCANVALGPEMLLLVVNTAAGLLPVIAVEATALRRGDRSGGGIASGLSLSIMTGVVYVMGLSVGPWLNHIDIAHLLMGVSFFLMVRGCRSYVIAPREYVVAGPPIRRMTDTAPSPVGYIVHARDGAGRHTRPMATFEGGL